jgi:hypothetical protein
MRRIAAKEAYDEFLQDVIDAFYPEYYDEAYKNSFDQAYEESYQQTWEFLASEYGGPTPHYPRLKK